MHALPSQQLAMEALLELQFEEKPHPLDLIHQHLHRVSPLCMTDDACKTDAGKSRLVVQVSCFGCGAGMSVLTAVYSFTCPPHTGLFWFSNKLA